MNANAHWGFIIAAYLVTFGSVGVLVWRIVGEHRRLLAELSRFEDDGAEQ